MHCEKTFVRKN